MYKATISKSPNYNGLLNVSGTVTIELGVNELKFAGESSFDAPFIPDDEVMGTTLRYDSNKYKYNCQAVHIVTIYNGNEVQSQHVLIDKVYTSLLYSLNNFKGPNISLNYDTILQNYNKYGHYFIQLCNYIKYNMYFNKSWEDFYGVKYYNDKVTKDFEFKLRYRDIYDVEQTKLLKFNEIKTYDFPDNKIL